MRCSSFKTILIPVDFSINTEVAVSKTLEIIDTNSSDIYLLHVTSGNLSEDTLQSFELKLFQWKQTIEETLPAISVFCEIQQSSHIQKSIQDTAKRIQADLVVIGKN